MKDQSSKLSKRHGDASFEDLASQGFLPEAILNYIALLGWSPPTNEEIFTLDEMVKLFNIKNMSKSPSIFDVQKLRWLNSEYIKKMDFNQFWELTKERFGDCIKSGVNVKRVAELVKTRIETLNDIEASVDFVDTLPEYDTAIYTHKKMKTDSAIALDSLKQALNFLDKTDDYSEETLHETLMAFIAGLGIKNGQMLWPLRCALSGKQASFGGAIELLAILGKDESVKRIQKGIEMLNG
jgi:glutamyl-tRNA synthetase